MGSGPEEHGAGRAAASPPSTTRGRRGPVAVDVLAILEAVAGGPIPLRVRCWDGSVAGDASLEATLVVRSPRALTRMLWAPGELGLVRAFVSGDLDVDGDPFAVLDLPDAVGRLAHHQGLGLTPRERVGAVGTAWRLGVLGPPPPPPREELRRVRGRLHSRSRDSAAVSHHYDVGNDFYRLVLGPSMVYSCARWTSPPSADYTLDDAQRDKLDLVCAKLGLEPGMRLLDVGAGGGPWPCGPPRSTEPASSA